MGSKRLRRLRTGSSRLHPIHSTVGLPRSVNSGRGLSFVYAPSIAIPPPLFFFTNNPHRTITHPRRKQHPSPVNANPQRSHPSICGGIWCQLGERKCCPLSTLYCQLHGLVRIQIASSVASLLSSSERRSWLDVASSTNSASKETPPSSGISGDSPVTPF